MGFQNPDSRLESGERLEGFSSLELEKRIEKEPDEGIPEEKPGQIDLETASKASQPVLVVGETVESYRTPKFHIGSSAHSNDIPDGGYGWVIATCALFMNAATFGVNTAFGVYISFLIEKEYYSGGSPMRYAYVGGLSVSSSLLVAPLGGYLNRRFGFRVPLLLATLLLNVGQFTSGIVKTYPQFLVTQGLIFGLGIGFSFTTLVPILTQWFDRRIGIAQGIATAGSGLGGLFFSNITRLSIEKLGMRDAYFINGGISIFTMLIAIAFIRAPKAPIHATHTFFSLRIALHKGFLFVWLPGLLAMMSWFIALYSLASFATSALGLSQTQGAALQSILSTGQMVGRPFIGYHLDRLGAINVTVISHFISAIAVIALWYPARSFGPLVPFALLQGSFGGVVWQSPASLTASVLEYKDYSAALSLYWFAMALAAQFGQPIAVALNTYSENSLGRTGADKYLISIGFSAGLYFTATLLTLGVRIYVVGGLRGIWAWKKV